jgi:ribonucleoside-diphosphate reductase alpha chain
VQVHDAYLGGNGMNHTSAREPLPRRRSGVTHTVDVGGAAVSMTANRFADGRPAEVFATWGKEGSTTRGLMDAFSLVLSLALQYGVPADVVVAKLKNLRFEPLGTTDDPDLPEVTSVVDWVVRRIALDHLPEEDIEDTAGGQLVSLDEVRRNTA